jgi:DNA-binding response OmpR family regulator
MATRAQLVEALLEFPAPDRAEAARALLESLDDEDDPVDVETAWRDEIATRVHEIESGAVELEDGPTTMSRLRARARARLDRRGS